jgi:hypothetical protein
VPFLALTLTLFAAALFLPNPGPRPGPRFAALLGLSVLLATAYILLPENLGAQHGGYLKQRITPLLWLLALALMPEPRAPWRGVAGILVVGLTLFHAALNVSYAAPASDAIAEFTTAREAVGTGRIYFTLVRGTATRLSNPLAHAGDHFALGTGNVQLHNYQALTDHFPVRYRDHHLRSFEDFAGFPYRLRADTFVFWEFRPEAYGRMFADYEPIYAKGKLAVWRKKPAPDGDGRP